MNSSSPKITVALLGCGMMGQEHISYMKKYKNIKLKYLCDPNKNSIENALAVYYKDEQKMSDSAENNIAKVKSHDNLIVFDTEKEMFADPHVASEVDLLVIATPNYCHTPQLLKWARRSITILVEKPVAISLGQVKALRAASPNFKADIWVAMEYRYIPAIQKLLQVMDDIGPIKKIAIRENRYPFLSKVKEWNKDIEKSGDTLVEKCCHFFDLFRLISQNEMKSCTTMVHRGLNFENYGYQHRSDNPVPIIDGAYVLMNFHEEKQFEKDESSVKEETKESTRINHKTWNSAPLGCLELCMFAEGSRHQEEIIVTGLNGRVEAYLPENKVFHYKRPNNIEWKDRTFPPPKSSIKEVIYDCSDLHDVYDFADEIPQHSGYHYCSTAIEWKFLIDQIKAKNDPQIQRFIPQVSLEDGIKAVEMGISAMQNISNNDATAVENQHTSMIHQHPTIYPIVAFETLSSADLMKLALRNTLTNDTKSNVTNERKECDS